MEITVLCKVVDNFGDIGFVCRLCRSLCELDAGVSIRLVVSCLDSFSRIAPGIQPGRAFQEFRGWSVFDWNAAEVCRDEFSRRPPKIILECFQCGRPGWLEDILFAPDFSQPVRIINIEYLTAEEWADEFHLLKSGTRSLHVKKMNFMPGFTKKTGGLVLDRSFMRCAEDRQFARQVLSSEPDVPQELFSDSFKILLFSYQKDFSFLAAALSRFASSRNVCVFIAPGAGMACAQQALQGRNVPFCCVPLPYLRQESWDALLCLMDFAFVRGEDSFSRACLAGIPFVWNCYPQDGEFQLVKLDAFLRRLAVPEVSLFSFLYNRNFSRELCPQAFEVLPPSFPAAEEECAVLMERLAFQLLEHSGQLKEPFVRFSRQLRENGNLAEHLLNILHG